ncbi:MAG: hypothetical protein LBU18_07740 [Treponema sp.]|jgi:hypothetical protein|nr:hypothetical protein [Treponema sp.]
MWKTLAAALAVSCLLASCPIPIVCGGGEDRVKPPVVLQLTVTNNMDVPISVQIRRCYKKGYMGSSYVDSESVYWDNESAYRDVEVFYTEWKKYDILPDKSVVLGDETVTFMKDGEETKWSGLTLLDDELNRWFGSKMGNLSFELEAAAGDRLIRLAGYKSKDPAFTGTGFCDLILKTYSLSAIWRNLVLFHKKSGWNFRLESPALLRASLNIKAGGDYVFDMEQPYEIPSLGMMNERRGGFHAAVISEIYDGAY